MGYQRFLWGTAAGIGFAVEKYSWACTLLEIRCCTNLHECIPQKTGFNASAVYTASLVARTKHAFILGEDTTEKPLMFSNPIPSRDLRASAVSGTALLLSCVLWTQVRNWQLSLTVVHLSGPLAEKAARVGKIRLDLPWICWACGFESCGYHATCPNRNCTVLGCSWVKAVIH